MTKNEVLQLFKMIASAYQNFEATSEKLNVWHEFLKDQDFQSVKRNLARHINAEKFTPTIAEIIVHRPRETNDYIDKLEEMRKRAASPEVVQRSLAQIKEILNG